jgi:hypothetical protein
VQLEDGVAVRQNANDWSDAMVEGMVRGARRCCGSARAGTATCLRDVRSAREQGGMICTRRNRAGKHKRAKREARAKRSAKRKSNRKTFAVILDIAWGAPAWKSFENLLANVRTNSSEIFRKASDADLARCEEKQQDLQKAVMDALDEAAQIIFDNFGTQLWLTQACVFIGIYNVLAYTSSLPRRPMI